MRAETHSRQATELAEVVSMPAGTVAERASRWLALARWSEARVALRRGASLFVNVFDEAHARGLYPDHAKHACPPLDWLAAMREATAAALDDARELVPGRLDASDLRSLRNLEAKLATAAHAECNTAVDIGPEIDAAARVIDELAIPTGAADNPLAAEHGRDFANDAVCTEIAKLLRNQSLQYGALVERMRGKTTNPAQETAVRTRLADMVAAGLLAHAKRMNPYALTEKGRALYFPGK